MTITHDVLDLTVQGLSTSLSLFSFLSPGGYYQRPVQTCSLVLTSGDHRTRMVSKRVLRILTSPLDLPMSSPVSYS